MVLDRSHTPLLRVARMLHGVTQAELANDIGVTNYHLCRLERGRARPSPALRHRLAARLGLPPDMLFTEVEADALIDALRGGGL